MARITKGLASRVGGFLIRAAQSLKLSAWRDLAACGKTFRVQSTLYPIDASCPVRKLLSNRQGKAFSRSLSAA
jgi:hypothetical protein